MKTSFLLKTITACIFISITSAIGHAKDYTYNKRVTIDGTVTQKVFPGSPNFESIEAGDSKQVAHILRLKTPIEVAGTKEKGAPEAKTEQNVGEIQLANSEGKLNLSNYVGKEVTITGSLFHQSNAQHRTPVLLNVDTIKLFNAQH